MVQCCSFICRFGKYLYLITLGHPKVFSKFSFKFIMLSTPFGEECGWQGFFLACDDVGLSLSSHKGVNRKLACIFFKKTTEMTAKLLIFTIYDRY